MANKRHILIVTMLIAILGIAAWFVLRPDSEPIYKGKPLTYWLDERAEGSDAAVDQIGTNAIPTLLRLLNTHDSKLKLKLIQLAQKQHFINITLRPADFRRLEAKDALTRLGPLAQSAMPDLLKIYREHRPGLYDDPRGIGEIFGSMGPAAADAVPTLAHDTTDPDLQIRYVALNILGGIQTRPDVAVPTLAACLRDPSENVRVLALLNLTAYRTNAQSAVPEVIKALADPSFDVKCAAAAALRCIDPEAAAEAGVK